MEKRSSPIFGDHGFEGTRDSYDAVAKIANEDRAELNRVLAIVEAVNVPMKEQETIFELGRLRVQTKARAEDAENMEFLLRVYAEDMREYPADIVKAACRRWARINKFFPAWAELKGEMDYLARNRKALLRVLRTLNEASA